MICDFRSILLNKICHLGTPCKYNLCVWHVCVASFPLGSLYFASMTVLSHSCWLRPPLVLLGIHSLESEMCLHFEHVTNYLLRLTLRDLAEAFTLLRCCLGQTYFRGWLSQFDCLYLTGVLQARCEPRRKVKLELCVGVCV